MRQSGKGVERRFDLFWSQSKCAGRRKGCAGVLMIMRTGQSFDLAQVNGRNLPPFTVFRQKTFTRKNVPTGAIELV